MMTSVVGAVVPALRTEENLGGAAPRSVPFLAFSFRRLRAAMPPG